MHLTRHPRGTIQSLAKIWNNIYLSNDYQSISPLDYARFWLNIQRNILNFTAPLSPEQHLRIKGENILSEPDLYLCQIAEWLGIETNSAAIEAMKHPENSPYACIGPESAPLGNARDFLEIPICEQERFRNYR